ncbi:hypothetical protein BC830DRAFT_1107015 [Chytriomyces sp. MP71]|nr:hypothetical protein BC830DRAFT_1107015 [Chytriomyces sp. MP71]
MFPVLSVQPVHARRSLSSYHDTEYSSISLDEYSDSGSEAGKEESDWKVGTASEAQSPSQVEPLRSDTPVRVPSTFDGLSRNLGLSEHDTPASNPHIHKDSHANSHGHGTDGTLPTISEFNHVNAQLSVAGFAPISQSLEPSSTLSLVHRLVVALNALHSAHSNAQDTHSFLLSDNTILSDRVARLRREVADRDAEVLKLKELRREADDDTKVAHARIKSLERELKTLKNDFIALAQKVGGCCDNGIKNFVNSPSKAAKYGTACAKCYAKLRQSKSCTAQWIEGVGFIESENEPPSTNIISPSVGYARRRGPPPMSSMSKRPTSVPSSPFSSAIHKPIVPASKLLSYSVCSPTMAVPSLTSFQIALSPSDDFDEAIHQTRPNHRSSSASRIIPTLIPGNILASSVLNSCHLGLP